MIRCCRRKNNGSKICIKTHARRKRYRKVNEQAHGDRENPGGKRRRQENRIPPHVDLTKSRQRVRVDRKDVGHRHKRSQARHNLRTHCRTVLFQFKKPIHDKITPP
ncbi:hypothetical protein D3C81_1116550 [compost metagenome]